MLGGGEHRIAKQHEKGKLTARERIQAFLDPGSFMEAGALVQHRCTDFGMEKQNFYGQCSARGRREGGCCFQLLCLNPATPPTPTLLATHDRALNFVAQATAW